MDPRREFVLPSAGVGQPGKSFCAGRCANTSILLPLANPASWAAAESCRAPCYISPGNSHSLPCLLSGCTGALSVPLRSSVASSSHAIDASRPHEGT